MHALQAEPSAGGDFYYFDEGVSSFGPAPDMISTEEDVASL